MRQHKKPDNLNNEGTKLTPSGKRLGRNIEGRGQGISLKKGEWRLTNRR